MILVIGDFMVDEYVHVHINRISPEAPVPVMIEDRREFLPGGAANVAANVKSLRHDVRLISVLGVVDSRWWNEIISRCPWALWINDETRPTTTKTRFIADRGQQVARLDLERADGISQLTIEKLKEAITVQLLGVKVIVLSDYQKGVLRNALLVKWILDGARALKIPVIVDSKAEDVSYFRGATIFTPNEKEFNDTYPFDAIIVETLGHRGMRVHNRGEQLAINAWDVHAVADVTGAGDTVVAALAVWIAEHGIEDIEAAARFANRAASVAVSKRGTATVAREEIVT